MLDGTNPTRKPLRFGVAQADDVWLSDLGNHERISAGDLRDLKRKAKSLRMSRPGVDVLVDINVMLATDADVACRSIPFPLGHDSTDLLYVGTPRGLIGLIADLYSMGIVDGAILQPLRVEGVDELIWNAVLPGLSKLAAGQRP